MTTDPPIPSESQLPSETPPRRGVGRIIKWVVLGIVVVVVIGLAIVWFNLNGIVRRTVETQASSSLDLKTTLGGAAVSIFGGKVSLIDLKVGSPPGYQAPQMLALGEAGVKVNLSELRGEPVHVKTVSIDRPRVVIEASGTKLNFQALMDRPSQPPPPDKSGEAKEPMKLIIDELTVSGAQVALRPGLKGIAGVKDEYTLSLPDVVLKNVGTGEGNQNGVAIKEVVVQLFTALAAKAAESDQLPPELKQLLNLNVEAVAKQMGAEVNKQIGRATKELEKKLPGDVGKKVGEKLEGTDVGKEVEKGIGGLLGKKEKQPTTRSK